MPHWRHPFCPSRPYLIFDSQLASYIKIIIKFFYILFSISIQRQPTLQICSYNKEFWKYATNLQENTHAEVQFQ